MPRSVFLKGTILLPDRFLDGHVEIHEGDVVACREGSPPSNGTVAAKGIILPRLFDSHIHIGDSFLHPAPSGMTVEELVGPPAGYKHRKLREAGDDEVVRGITNALDTIIDSGVGGFIDFREGGIAGVELSKTAYAAHAMMNTLECVTLGRPSGLACDKEEADGLLRISGGLGLSAYSDWDATELCRLAELARDAGCKLLGLHASEHTREPMDEILELRPDMLVHLVRAEADDLEMVREAGVPVVLCSRSNEFFGLKRDYKLLFDSGVTLLGGTDNSMICRPQCLEEMAFVISKARESGAEFRPLDALKMFTTAPSKVLNDKNLIARPDPFVQAELMVLERDPAGPGGTHDPYGVLAGLGSDNVNCIISKETIYYPGGR